LAIAGAAFVASSPFILIDAGTFIRNFMFVSGLSVTEHPGMEGVGVFFYAQDLLHVSIYLCLAIVLSAAAVVAVGNRTERFVLSLPVAYFILFSVLRTKFDRFALPAVALFLLVASGLPSILGRRFASRAVIGATAAAAAYGLLFLSIGTMAMKSMPIPGHEMLSPPDGPLLEWIEHNVPSRSNILIESGIVPLIDTLMEPGQFGAELRQSVVAVRPALDHTFVDAVYVGGLSNYGLEVLKSKNIDYAIVSARTMDYIERRCSAFPEVCDLHRELRAKGRVVYESPAGVERIIVYAVRRGEAKPAAASSSRRIRRGPTELAMASLPSETVPI
jgi:hypothetical protein